MTRGSSVRSTVMAISVFLPILAFSGIVLGEATTGSPGASAAVASFSSADPVELPSARMGHGMAYDAESDRVILFGGLNGTALDDTWAYDFNTKTWENMEPVTRPPGRWISYIAYDDESDRIIVFGGMASNNFFDATNDTWAYDYNTNTWTDLNPALAPTARWGPSMGYDAGSDRIVIFGGRVSNTLFNETWAFDFNTNTWTNMNPASAPSPRGGNHLVYDAESDRLVLFGGERTGFTRLDETWTYDYDSNTWMNMNPDPKPSPRVGSAMTYDGESDRVVLFGGLDVSAFDDTWAYNLNTNTWTNKDPMITPAARLIHRMAYDSNSDRIIMFGGNARTGPFGALEPNNETWAYDINGDSWTPLTPPSAPRSLEASAGEGLVDLTWLAPSFDYGSPVSNFRIYRGEASGDLSFLVEVDDVLAYTDSDVTVGTTYYYQVSAVTGAGEGPRSEEKEGTPIDTIDPAVTITAPKDGDSLAPGMVEVTGTATDNIAVEKVEISKDATEWKLASGTTSWSGTLEMGSGEDTIYARATDTSGNVATASITVHVDGGFPLWVFLAAGGGVGAAAVAIGILVILRRRKRGREEGGE